jgi:hypothetical protein
MRPIKQSLMLNNLNIHESTREQNIFRLCQHQTYESTQSLGHRRGDSHEIVKPCRLEFDRPMKWNNRQYGANLPARSFGFHHAHAYISCHTTTANKRTEAKFPTPTSSPNPNPTPPCHGRGHLIYELIDTYRHRNH